MILKFFITIYSNKLFKFKMKKKISFPINFDKQLKKHERLCQISISFNQSNRFPNKGDKLSAKHCKHKKAFSIHMKSVIWFNFTIQIVLIISYRRITYFQGITLKFKHIPKTVLCVHRNESFILLRVFSIFSRKTKKIIRFYYSWVFCGIP